MNGGIDLSKLERHPATKEHMLGEDIELSELRPGDYITTISGVRVMGEFEAFRSMRQGQKVEHEFSDASRRLSAYDADNTVMVGLKDRLESPIVRRGARPHVLRRIPGT